MKREQSSALRVAGRLGEIRSRDYGSSPSGTTAMQSCMHHHAPSRYQRGWFGWRGHAGHVVGDEQVVVNSSLYRRTVRGPDRGILDTPALLGGSVYKSGARTVGSFNPSLGSTIARRAAATC
jgi:hypothetical protein